MITVKELIEILQGLDPNAYVVKPGHSDCGGSYDDIFPDDLVRLLSLKEYDESSSRWRGKYHETQHLEPGGIWAYCV